MEILNRTDVLADWQIPADEWQRFVSYESVRLARAGKIALTCFVGLCIGVLLIFAFVITSLFFYDGRLMGKETLPLAITCGVVSVIAAGIAGLCWFIAYSWKGSLRTATGNVLITLHGVKVNDRWTGWRFDSGGWQFLKAEKKQVGSVLEGTFEVLEFLNTGRGVRETAGRNFRTIRVPIRKGSEADVSRVIERLHREKEKNISNYHDVPTSAPKKE